MSGQVFLLVDGNGIAYKCFYALPQLKTSWGFPTNAVYGFLNALLKALETFNPAKVVVAFDAGKPTFRHKMDKEYKATRQKMPEDLQLQLQVIREFLDAMGIPWVMKEGYEADDLIGTLARKAEKEGFEPVVVTADRDLFQIVSDKTKVAYVVGGMSKIEMIDRNKVKEKIGVLPEQIPDFKALAGDKADNIPGIKGIGETTARSLLSRFPSVEEILENLRLVDPRARSAIEKEKEKLLHYKELARIAVDAPIDIDIGKLPEFGANWKNRIKTGKAAELLGKYEFKSIARRIGVKTPTKVTVEVKAEIKPASVKEAQSPQEVVEFLENRRGKEVVFKVLAPEGHPTRTAPYFAFFGDEREGIVATWDILREGIGDVASALAGVKVVSFRVKRDLEHLLLSGGGIVWPWFDLALAMYACDPDMGTRGFADAFRFFTGEAAPFDLSDAVVRSIAADRSRRLTVLGAFSKALLYATRKAVEKIGTIAEDQRARSKRHTLEDLVFSIEVPLALVLADMEATGVAVDGEYLRELGKEFANRIREIERKIYSIAGEVFNISSPAQLSRILFVKLGIKPPEGAKKTIHGYSTSADVLEALRGKHPIIEHVLAYRQYTKLKSTYVDALPKLINPKTGRIHTNFNQTVTATGRLSSSEPNLQNIPARSEEGARIRKAFVAKEGHKLLSADYSQIELRVLAHMSGDEKLIQAFMEGEDIHRRTAAEIFGVKPEEVTPEMRSMAKVVNFGIVYGMTAFGLAQRLGISRHEAKEFMERYFARCPKVKEFIKETIAFARRMGYVETLFGRRRYLPAINSRNAVERNAAERMAINTPVQGTAAEIIKYAMVSLWKKLREKGLKTRMLLQVHDELVFEVPEEELEEAVKIIKAEMEQIVELKVPLVVDVGVGQNWGETK